MCGFIEGEVKAEGRSCSCLEGLISVNNKRKEVKSRNCPCSTLIQSAMHVSLTVPVIGVCASDAQVTSIFKPFSSSLVTAGVINTVNMC